MSQVNNDICRHGEALLWQIHKPQSLVGSLAGPQSHLHDLQELQAVQTVQQTLYMAVHISVAELLVAVSTPGINRKDTLLCRWQLPL